MKRKTLSLALAFMLGIALLPPQIAIAADSTLTSGQTYYFDLSAQGIPGTANSALPGGSLNWVPFTYVGEISAYSRQTDGVSTDGTVAVSSRKLFIADYNVTTSVSWDTLDSASLIFGKAYGMRGTEYQLRAPSVGSGSIGSYYSPPLTNEWDQIYLKDGGNIKNYNSVASWGQDSASIATDPTTMRIIRGGISRADYESPAYSYTIAGSVGFRPVLQANSADLSAVTLHLNGGSIGGSLETVQIVVSSNAKTYPAPDKTGLTRPAESGGNYFRWNTQADGTGMDYEAGSNVPVSVTTLYAKWAPVEQYSLTTGETYYFDLSGEAIPGTVNVDQTSMFGFIRGLPDNTLHYVPFTYVGTTDSYNLSAAQAVTQEWADANKSGRSLFLADYNITHTVSWDVLNGQNLIFGREYQYNNILYQLRAPSEGTGEQGIPASNEWSRILEKSGTEIKNSTLYSWGQDTWSENFANRVIRNDSDISSASSSDSPFFCGFRPVLQIKNADGLTPDGLEVITINLSGGYIGEHTGRINIVVKRGSSYTAPSDEGITRSAEGDYFMWKGSDNVLYAPGASVPAGVTGLTALFEEETGGVPETVQTIMLGTEGIHGYTGADGYSYVYFGTYNGDLVKWRVLAATGGNSTAPEPASFATSYADIVAAADAMFLLSDSLLGTGAEGDIYFDKDGVKNGGQTNFNEWQGSDAQLWCKDFAGIAGAPENITDAFTAGEMTSILHTTKSDESYAEHAAPDNILNGDQLFFPSAREAETVAYGFINSVTRRALYKGSIGAWWLRTPYGTNASWLVSDELGGGGLGHHNAGNFPLAARPAMNIHLPSVIFSSAAEGGKDGAVGVLTSDTDYAGNEWKLTLKSDTQTVKVDSAVRNGNEVALTYSGATTGTNQYVSAIVTSADGEEIIRYGRLASTSGTESGAVTFALPGNFDADGYVLKVFSEQYNGDQYTDYASEPQAVTLAVATAPGITTTSLPSGTVGTPYSQALAADGDTPITWSIDSGSLPGDLTLTNGGVISGTPTVGGTFNFTVRATNDVDSDTQALRIDINPAPPTGTAPTITTATLPGGTAGTPYSQTLGADGDTPITWSLDGGSLPGGLTLSIAGVISGTPTAAGTYNFTVRAINGTGYDTQLLSIEIMPAAPPGSPPVITTDTLPNATVFMEYNQTLSVTSDMPVTWDMVGPFPNNGLGFFDGVVSGTPLVSGTFYFTVRVTNGAGSSTKEFSITISPPVPPAIVTASLPDGTVGAPYSRTLTADGSTPVTWNIVSGSLPNGLTLTGDTISGTPTLAGTFTFTVKAENGEGSDTKELYIAIAPAGGPGGDTSEKKEPRHISRTLTGGLPGMDIIVSGEGIRADAKLYIVPIPPNAEGYGAYSPAIGEASEEGRLLLCCNIRLTGGFIGRVTVSFHVGERYNGEAITILHYNGNRVETYTVVVEDGWATIVAEDLSPFAVIRTGIAMPDELAPDPPKTGGAQTGGFILLGLAAVSLTVAVFRRRRDI